MIIRSRAFLLFLGLLVGAVRGFAPPSRNSYLLLPPSSTCTKANKKRIINSSLSLFFGDRPAPTSVIEEQDLIKETNQGIPLEVIWRLEEGQSLPYDFEYTPSSSDKPIQLRIKQLEKNQVSKAVSLCLKEYGSYPSSSSKAKSELDRQVQSIMDDFENYLFSFVVLLGLGQRVERREKSEAIISLPQDHNVVCLYQVEQDSLSYNNGKETMIGMAEVSLQPPDPARTSPPFVLPTYVKNTLSKLGIWRVTKPYISNVLVTNEFRGKGYSKILMATCEGLAKSWGYKECYLHVDADPKSGGPAQNLYKSIGYSPVIDETYNKDFAWLGIDVANRGLYIVDGVALLFLKKSLH
ncbi:hypothetical protein CTEN210_11719 [Chaetoceros tenuissimus]|uniref:N-acetyltransferase domain-containing protein n=1 Tax=Chaetoceros tenuissimus TaxID=426638 RepID=A0AAD3D063_9STRA|nr:hypothetical protein CTEN210_11719 [Chaetoceros tenuissimus]